MLRFQIKFDLGCSYSQFRLNDKWSLSCKDTKDHRYPKYLVFLKHDGVVPKEEILVSGSLSVLPCPVTGKKTFSFFWPTDDESMFLGHLESSLVPDGIKLRLTGLITIVSERYECICFLPREVGGKCDEQKSLAKMSNDFERLLELQEPCFSDVTVTCGDVSIPAHKNILSARSPYFAKMFTHPMKENLENKVNITDLDEAVFQAMMMFIYSGKTPTLTVSSATDLLLAAEKYLLRDLKQVCCAFLMDNITSDNVINLLLLGDSLDENLKESGIDYIHRHWPGEYYADIAIFEDREDWKNLKIQRPELAIVVLRGIVRRREIEKFQIEY